MSDQAMTKETFFDEVGKFVKFIISELKPKGKLITPFNLISLPVMLTGAIIIIIRFAYGLGSVTNMNQEYPWGIWVGFDVVTGVAFAGGAYIITFVVYVCNVKKYHPLVKATVLNGLLAYCFYAGALVFDLGKPWNIINPVIGNKFGYNSVLFLVSWHFMLYMATEFLEFSPTIAQWLGWERVRKVLYGLTLGAVIFGITLSSLHQSGLGALFLMAKNKIHPLWYTEFIPVLFFVSSIFAGLSMIIFEGSISHKVFSHRVSHDGKHESFDNLIIGLSKGASIAMFVYFFFKILVFIHGKHWVYLNTSWGYLWMVEMIGFIAIPCFLYYEGGKYKRVGLLKIASVITLIGIILNRLNISVITYNWQLPTRYIPSWQEVMVTLMVVFAEIWVFRWVVNRMPVLSDEN